MSAKEIGVAIKKPEMLNQGGYPAEKPVGEKGLAADTVALDARFPAVTFKKRFPPTDRLGPGKGW